MSSSFPHLESPTRSIQGSLTRFAPAPTGWLHLGHVLNACYVWHTAGELGCHVLLRIEDHDRERCRPEYEAAILDDLEWLGFVPDVHSTDCFRRGRCDGRQSDRGPVYEAAVEILVARNLVYGCDCSRRSLSASADSAAGAERRYPGTCRDRGLPLATGLGWRVRVDESVEDFDDALLGPQTQRPKEQCGDFLIRDRHGNWTYQFAVAVDDHRQSIDLVIRGIDLLESTGRQIYLARLLGRRDPATYMHHPLIMKTGGAKLSKADGDTGIRQLRATGWTRDDVIAEAMRRGHG